MKPSVIGNDIWDRIYQVYVKDEFNLGIHRFFEAENPAALQEITAVMLETARKGYWKATEEQLKEISGLHVRFISEHGPACSGFVCDNQKLQKFVISHIPENGREVYQEQLDRTREVQTEHRQNAVVLKKEASYQPAQENRNTLIGLKPVFTGMLIVGILLVLVVIWRRQKR